MTEPGPEPAPTATPEPAPTPAAPAPAPTGSLADLARRVRAVTPARVFVGRVGTSYRTADQLALRADHAAARDAVDTELDLAGPDLAAVTAQLGLFAVDTAAADRAEYLRRPDLGRRLSETGRHELARRCPAEVDLQVVVGDGLSTRAVEAQVPVLLPALVDAATEAGWRVGQPFAVRNCCVGIMNDVGDLLRPTAVVLLIGERPGLATAESLSAYLGWLPRAGHNDADRNLLSNIHARGIRHDDAVTRILGLLDAMRAADRSGVTVKEPPSSALARRAER
nr:ethanolamine ammonia-lyase subunit EutC [Micromonospora sp. DSM 115978]